MRAFFAIAGYTGWMGARICPLAIPEETRRGPEGLGRMTMGGGGGLPGNGIAPNTLPLPVSKLRSMAGGVAGVLSPVSMWRGITRGATRLVS